jgi:hypothetical protein
MQSLILSFVSKFFFALLVLGTWCFFGYRNRNINLKFCFRNACPLLMIALAIPDIYPLSFHGVQNTSRIYL